MRERTITGGKDLAGPPTVRAWANYAASIGASPEIVSRAREWAEEMENYQRIKGEAKIPDM